MNLQNNEPFLPLPQSFPVSDNVKRTGRLEIGNPAVLSIAAKVLDETKGQANIAALQNRSGFSWYNRHVTVKNGNDYFDINIRSCAKRLGISKERVFELAKFGSFNALQSLINKEREGIKATIKPLQNTNEDNLINAIYLLRQPLTDALENNRSYSKKIQIANDTYEIKVTHDQGQGKILLKKTNVSQSPQDKPQEAKPQEAELQDCFIIATKKDATSFKVNSKTLMSTLKENNVSNNFSLQDLDNIKKYVYENRDSITELFKKQNKKTIIIKPNKDNKIPRALQFNADGSVYIHFSRSKKIGDRTIGEGGFKKAKFALDLMNGNLLVAGKMSTSRINKVIGEEEAKLLNKFKDDPNIAQLIEFVDQDDTKDQVEAFKEQLMNEFKLSEDECTKLLGEIHKSYSFMNNLVNNPKLNLGKLLTIEKNFELKINSENGQQFPLAQFFPLIKFFIS
jgi:hypothetical protein